MKYPKKVFNGKTIDYNIPIELTINRMLLKYSDDGCLCHRGLAIYRSEIVKTISDLCDSNHACKKQPPCTSNYKPSTVSLRA